MAGGDPYIVTVVKKMVQMLHTCVDSDILEMVKKLDDLQHQLNSLQKNVENNSKTLGVVGDTLHELELSSQQANVDVTRKLLTFESNITMKMNAAEKRSELRDSTLHGQLNSTQVSFLNEINEVRNKQNEFERNMTMETQAVEERSEFRD